QVTSVEPKANVLPEAGEQITGKLPSRLSNAEALKLAIAPDGPVASVVMLAGTVTTGGVVSIVVHCRNRTETLFKPGLVSAMSCLPSLSKSPTTTQSKAPF